MERSEIMRITNAVFRDVFDDDTLVVTEQTTASDIEDWDSLTHIELVASIEDAFGIRFTMKEVLGMRNVGEMADILMLRAKG